MRVALSVESGAADGEMRSLFDWLCEDSAARRHGRPQWEASTPHRPDLMGGVFDVITLALNSAFSAGQLLLAIAQWRAGRRGDGPAVTVTYPDGVTITLSGPAPQNVEELVCRLTTMSRG
ncbi:effector-associated constant component EACC1 [Streptantibioticus silvisoli]|jgi:hypothetical protein|uniref:Uncharacterized protein n=1 Tax=Streptantibioticus silvisoli TaxID=2705255 RepID=A0ABT6W134_9ACTN|nr:hypothetical protein [Streptantibioticus silvisoli]MDI5964455.1 hypothetical protein [Streptantibioticus silvisoli]